MNDFLFDFVAQQVEHIPFNVRKGPSTSTAIIARIPDYSAQGYLPDPYPCLGKSGNWYKIKINGKVGYVRANMVDWDY